MLLKRVVIAIGAVLIALIARQQATITALRAEVAAAQERAIVDARAIASDSLANSEGELIETLAWLNQLYAEPDGLGRPQGLWIDGHPDYQGIAVWLDIYLRRRLKGDSPGQARDAIADQIKASDEFRSKHPGR